MKIFWFCSLIVKEAASCQVTGVGGAVTLTAVTHKRCDLATRLHGKAGSSLTCHRRTLKPTETFFFSPRVTLNAPAQSIASLPPRPI